MRLGISMRELLWLTANSLVPTGRDSCWEAA